MKTKGTASTQRSTRPPLCSLGSRALTFPLVRLALLPVALLACAGALHAAEVTIVAPDSPLLRFAVGKLESALQRQGDTLKRKPAEAPDQGAAIVVSIDAAAVTAIGPDGFRRVNSRQGLNITGSDERGAMYGVLDAAEQIRLGTAWNTIADRTVKASFEFRALKFNLPWAAYRTSPVIEQHDATCRDLKFWEAFLDMMAANRFNALTLWSLHPFHSMVRPRNFPEASSFTDAELAEWRTLWRGIFALAKERGIETYLVNWNIFVSPEFARAHHVARWSDGGRHIGSEAENSEIVVRYTREVVTQVLDEYPDLTGLGITLGEQMGGMSPDQRRAWLDRTFFAGMADAKRPAKFIYRAPLSANVGSGGTTSEENDRRTRAQIEGLTRNVTGPVYVEFKHNWSHAHSSPDLFMVHGGKLSDAYWNPVPTHHKVVWTMRNEDIFVLRWGQPDFVRAFVRNQSQAHVGGAIVGSECYIPALDYITAPGPHRDWRFAFERQWLFYAVWGRVLYDSGTPDRVFAALLEERFGPGLGDDLLEAWKRASQVPLHFASFFRGTWDGSLYTEGFSSWIDRDDGARTFFDVDAFIKRPVLDTKRYLNIADFVQAGGVTAPGVLSPLALAAQLDRDGAETMHRVAAIRAQRTPSPTLECELTDLEAWVAYGNYFAEKLRGGVALATARAQQDPARQTAAIAALERALGHWQRLAELGAKYNRLPVLSSARQPFSWAALTSAVRADIEIARKPLGAR
ncbi:beta-N-acetylhexosaminidase family protein [Horticoccus sp. 23ND18S-11]|uniref:hypothetical protein n=1 Tax=Horticoccus sp. 23ND18S-11 TaxID=3391832 RepID=UPI0039C93F2B